MGMDVVTVAAVWLNIELGTSLGGKSLIKSLAGADIWVMLILVVGVGRTCLVGGHGG